VVKTRLSFAFALPVALFGIALVVGVGCGDSTPSTSDGGGGKAGGSGGKGGSAAGTSGGGTQGNTAGTGGGGTQGNTAGTNGGGTSGGGTSGGGTGGSAAGTSGGGRGGSTAGTGGSAAGAGGGGRGGNTAGAGGGAAGAGGGAAGAGGGGRGGNTAGAGGGAAGAGGGGRGGNTAGTGGRNADAGSDAATDARDAGPTCNNVCTAGNHRCAGGGSETCVVGSNGCTQWGTATICAGVTTCAAGSGLCACPAAPTGCTAAGTFCSGTTNVITCNRDAQGCFSVSAPVACPIDTTCKGALPNAACTCDNDPSCSGANSFCMNTSTKATCGLDSNTPACDVVKSTTTCGGSSFCSGGACVCPAIGTTAGTGCGTLAATSCSGTDILTCVTETTSGCSIWQASTHCGTTGFTCGVKGGGTPACQCPANAGTDVYVDPVAGSDVVAGVGAVFPTGIQTPAACRYASLTNGLTKVPTPGRVIAISAVPPVTFAGETFPLTIPASVSVLTADAVFTPANYVIDFNAGTTAVMMSNGTALRGFTVLNGTAVSQALVSCTAGSATLDTVVLNGATKAVDGLDVLGTCAATLDAVQIDSVSGVALNVSSSAASSITGGTLSAALIGLQQTAGSVTATGLHADGNGQYGILLPASSAGTPTLSLGGTSTASGNGSLGNFAGISIGKGSLTASNTSVDGNGGIGIQLTSAGSHQLTTVEANGNGAVTTLSFGVGMTAGTLTASALTASSNTDSGISVSAGNATFTGATVMSNTGRGLIMSGGTVTISGGTFNSNGISKGMAGVLGSAGTLTIGGGTVLASNGAHGVHVTGAVTVVAGANIHNNTGNGVLVNDTAGVTVNIGSAATVTSINANGINGILVNGSPATGGGANSLTIDTVGIGTNGKFGIYLQGTASVAATIKGSTVTANGDVGIMVEQQAGANTTTEAIQNNDVNGNNTSASTTHTVGGILFNTSSTLSSFIGNKVHSNVGDELGFNAVPNVGLRWVINPPSAACDATANSLYCYGTGNVGLRILTPGTETVDGQHVHWTNNPPTSGIDFSGAVTVTNPCTVVTTCP
jgi:hypothetical protein